MSAPPPITALLLAGGQGRRMGGADKGLQLFLGAPLAANALQRLRRQTLPPAHVLISANRHLGDYQRLGVPVHADALPGFAGPLAGFLTGLTHARTPLLLVAPCDVPRFPLSLCERLAHVLQAQKADIVMATAPGDDGRPQAQPTFCLMRTHLRDSLQAYLAAGGRKAGAWAAQHGPALAPFGPPDDDPLAFANANTLAELHRLEQAGQPASPGQASL